MTSLPENHVTNGEPETVVSASIQKIKSIKNPIKPLFFIFFFIKSETSDTFVNHFDGHFAYLKTLDFYFKDWSRSAYSSLCMYVLHLLPGISLVVLFVLWSIQSASPPPPPSLSRRDQAIHEQCIRLVCFLWNTSFGPNTTAAVNWALKWQ